MIEYLVTRHTRLKVVQSQNHSVQQSKHPLAAVESRIVTELSASFSTSLAKQLKQQSVYLNWGPDLQH